AAAGDLDALTIRDRFADAVAAAVRILVLTCDVEHVVLGGGVAEVGAPLVVAVAEALGRQATGSAFLRSLGLADRLRIVQPGALVAPVGAALALGASLSPTLTPVEAVPWKL
ncbi:MAG: ROK family protein, partial [Cellulomonadaceae bacterium]|nr:ROK family protein [Cellulomonadaceae bacterium]